MVKFIEATCDKQKHIFNVDHIQVIKELDNGKLSITVVKGGQRYGNTFVVTDSYDSIMQQLTNGDSND